ncbi:T9SS type A sorting domain-containing protein [Chryseobacterium sp.]|uniref:T9SS type A sorting domain-containing protein n=1 Tax=Chryseobacterium sp. TaxID=1871047 RepID=UPI00334014AD
MKLKLLLGALIFTAITAKAQVSSINENFDSFTNTGDGSLPQNGWTSQISVTDPNVAPRLSVEAPGAADKYIQAYSLFSPNTPFYLISPQIVAPAGGQTLSITTLRIGGAPGSGSVEIGLVASPTDMSTFTSLGSPIPMTNSTPTVTTVNVPASTYQYIAFKFSATANHQALRLDNVVLSAAGSLGVNDIALSKESIKFAVTSDNTALQFISNKEPKNIQIYSASGQKAAEGKLKGHQFNISNLQSGVYYTVIETAEGKTISSKFIKK